ncbi:MAG: hypothetical protein ACI9C1_000447 [Candidatus Aldehydirespiratoraceae bacterium]|jgi:hypothetical protein
MAPNPSRVRAAAKPAPKAAPKRADLRVVRTDDRVRTVGAISSAVAAFFFLVMFALAGLHAVVVQTQSELDGVNREISNLEEARVVALADLAYSGSAIGVETTALAAGFVPAARPINLPLVPPGQLAPPTSADPFAASIETME